MKMELNDKKYYIAPMMQVITVEGHDIIATSGDDEEPYTGRLN